MGRVAAWVALATVASAVGGCGAAKELPDEIPKAADTGEKAVPVPAASEPKAKEFVARAVKAFTGGKPELVAKGSAGRVSLRGTMSIPVDGQKKPFPTVRVIAAVWPDRFAAANELTYQGLNLSVRTWLHGTDLTVIEGAREQDLPNRAEYIKAITADATGQHWMALMVPLSDPKAVVFDFQSTDVTSPQTGQPQSVHQMKLAIRESPVFQLVFDAKTDLLLRVEYTSVEQGVRRRKQWAALEHKTGPDGQLLPRKTECRHDGAVVEEWEVEKWEFPGTIPDAEFSPSKK